jgi:hypothetical protein
MSPPAKVFAKSPKSPKSTRQLVLVPWLQSNDPAACGKSCAL